MKRISLIAIICLQAWIANSQTAPDKLFWEGYVSYIRIVLEVPRDIATHSSKGVFYTPDMLGDTVQVKLRVTNDSLIAIEGDTERVFSGRFNQNKNEIKGTWQIDGNSEPLTLKATTAAMRSHRPQTPVPPFPYVSEDVEYDNSDRSIHFGGTLTLPNKAQKFPSVLLITGSGQEDRDETLFGHKIFAVIADHLTRNGIAVLRVDDRGVGKTTGDVIDATSADFAKDVLAGIDYLKSRKEIDSKQIGLLGHSEGGVIAPLVINQSHDVAFFISMAGVGVTGMELGKKQNGNMLKASGMPADRLAAFSLLMGRLFDEVYKTDSSKNVELLPVFRAWRSSQPSVLIDSMKMAGAEGERGMQDLFERLNLPWMRYFIKYDPEPLLSKITIPVLAINGSKDIQVSAKENLEGIRRLLTKAGNKDFEIIEVPGVNHLFQTAKTGDLSEYAQIEETVSPEVLEIISAWINKHVKK
ncbi:MAG: hypothetical protein K0S09_2398 [Sphingobacteriaceae bacterium]|jgi:pimeloyl-ACP methyl ester carboxylesterase|nr:hypothetical protein [Sphingobacteriaceae bacterium]